VSLAVAIDGSDVSTVSVSGSVTRRLNRPSQAQVRIPYDSAIGGAGSRLKVTINGTLVFHGFVLLCELDTAENMGYVVYNAQDPMELWRWRPARDGAASGDPGDFSNPTFIERVKFAPSIMEEIITQSLDDSDPAKGEGPLFLDIGTVESTTTDVSGAPTDWPMTIAEIQSLLSNAGVLDSVITPTDPGGGVMGTVDFYKGDFGSDLSGSVVFEYATGAQNIRNVRWNDDITNMCNKLWYYLGPRVGTAQDPAGDQHWCANVTGTSVFPSTVISGGDLTSLLSERSSSQSSYGVRMDIKIWDAQGDCSVPIMGYDLYKRLWVIESRLRQRVLRFVHITPTRNTAINSFGIGDLVQVNIDSSILGGVSAKQRVYEYTVSWDADGPFYLNELVTSPTQEGFGS